MSRRHTTVAALSLLLALPIAGCSSEKPAESRESALDINPSAAPGVAFTYRYDFDVPLPDVARVQETHAAACEHLGPARCRITGMHYSVGGGGETYASLDLKLDRDLARAFGRDGIAAVEKAGGKLTSVAIEGEDVAPSIASATRQSDDASRRREDISRRLSQPGLGDRERTELQAQLAALKDQQQQAQANRANSEQRLASTPMVMSYSGVSQLSLSNNPVADAAGATLDSGKTMVTVVLLALGYVLPWALLVLAAVALWRTRAVRWLRAYIAGRSTLSDDPAS